jgi:drug/metabolite transporter (DMT)-like permease
MSDESDHAARRRGVLLIVVSCVLFAGMAALARVLSASMHTGQIVFLRFAIGLVGTGGLFAYKRQRPQLGRPWLLASRGILGALAVYFYFVAISALGVGPATLLNYAAPCYAAVFAVLFLRERPTPHLIGGLVVATVGAALVAWSTSDASKPFALEGGAWAGLISAVFSGAAMTSIRALRRDTDATTVFFGFCVFGTLLGLPFALIHWTPLTPTLWAISLAMGVLSFGAQMLFTYAFGFVTASVGSATTQLTPAFSWVLGLVFLGEQLIPLSLVGALLCMGGVVWGTAQGMWRRSR